MRPFILAFIEDNVMSTDGGFICVPCGKFMRGRTSIRRHAEDRHVMAGISYQCPMCKIVRGSKNSFQVHIYSHHKELKGIKFEQCAIRDK